MVWVICITTMATAEDSDAASQRSELKRSWSGIRLNNLVIQMPTSALKKCPKMTERGCANGTSIAPKQRTADAPYKLILVATFIHSVSPF